MKAVSVCQSLQALSSWCSVFSTLPRGSVEPTFIALKLSQNEWENTRSWDLRECFSFGSLVAPWGARADNILVRGLSQYVHPGRPLQFELVLNTEYPSRIPAELTITAASVAFHAHVLVLLVHGTDCQPLQATLTPASAGTGIVTVTIDIPEAAPRDAEVVIDSVTFAGQAVSRCLTRCGAVKPFYMPVRLRVVTGMQAPLQLEGAVNIASTPVITSDGTLYAPKLTDGTPPDVRVFAFDGTPLPPLPLKTLGLSPNTVTAAFVAGLDGLKKDTDMLLFADANDVVASKLVAVDAATRKVRWSTALGGRCYGIAVLSAQGVVVASNMFDEKLHAHRLSDGAGIASIATNILLPMFVAADPATATVYAGGYGKVSAFRWNGAALVFDRIVETAGVGYRPLAVVPPGPAPAPGQRTSYLVVGTYRFPTLHVFSLPDHHLVHTHELEEMEVAGLAADPFGTALAVCNAASKAIHVLPWPLPGMELKLAELADV